MRHDYEGVTTEAADAMMRHLMTDVVGKDAATLRTLSGDEVLSSYSSLFPFRPRVHAPRACQRFRATPHPTTVCGRLARSSGRGGKG